MAMVAGQGDFRTGSLCDFCLRWHHAHAKLTFSNVEVKEITVKNSLHDSSYDGDKVIMILKVVAVYPV